MTSAVAQQLPQLASLQQVSERTAVAISTLRDWVRDGRLPAYRLPGNNLRVRVADVEALLVPVTPTK
ncbi:excisionase family DNA-binding protein [Mycobacterium avium]|uniref:excisionase family DNA-binding protein n=1 Tax=Mycobacterium avium TaxID=1764 RepID=UPI001CC34F73|nr:helix-turn-helix domain-containing protein [Mycobacterium avium]MBZ4581102.1 helix-turn-helix domain-containing protein [Mycobacterium avium subsp. hominissuis]MBZ4609025.1 helix-turn-helix domain-containing protein [Mycobacterium avium subsp. hominissuis]